MLKKIFIYKKQKQSKFADNYVERVGYEIKWNVCLQMHGSCWHR